MCETALAFGIMICISATVVEGGQEMLPAPVGLPVPDPVPVMPGVDYEPPIDDTVIPSENAPRIYEHSGDAGPDQTFFVVGSGLTDKLFAWGRSPDSTSGGQWSVKPQLVKDNYLAITLPDRSLDSVFLVWVRNDAGWSRPLRLNIPQPWWCWPKQPTPGQEMRIFGRDLARRPDRTTAFVYLAQPGAQGRWLEVLNAEKYTVTVRIPEDVEASEYQLWLHAGNGGRFGWGNPLSLTIREALNEDSRTLELPPGDGVTLEEAVNELAGQDGGTLQLTEGTYPYHGTLKIPAGITIAGQGQYKTLLQVVQGDPQDFIYTTGGSWNQAPGRVHTPGDMMEYGLSVPETGKWIVWLRYATEMSPWDQPGVSGNMILQVDDGDPVPLEKLPNTGSFGSFKWSRSAALDLTAGDHRLTWRNVKGGGISLDAYVFALDQDYQPGDAPFPETGDGVVVLQGEDVVSFKTREGVLPGRMRAAVWLSGDGAALRDLTVSGSPQVSDGVFIQSPESLGWISDCRIERCRILDIEGKHAEICGVRLVRAASAVVRDNEIWGRSPFFLSGVRYCNLGGNRLIPVTRFGGNAEAAIQGRNEVIEECIIENNLVDSPPGAEAGGPQVRRLIWVSTGRGSVTRNWFANNGVVEPKGTGAATRAGQMRFGGVAGMEQNVGEMILFEANHRTMYFGPLAGAGEQHVTLPKTIQPTPDERLGSVERKDLAYDANGNEIPFWPPDVEDGSLEPPITEYYVSVFRGSGQGQTRRVVAREGERLLLDRPWRTTPEEGSIVAVGTAFYRNLITGNYTVDGMTGIQLWISCMENIVSGNTIARMRRPAFFLYSNGTTLASSMPRTWNRGISPLFFNHIEGNRAEECSAGALVTSGDYQKVPIEFPRALGNVIRNNSFIRSRTDGVIIVSGKGKPADGDSSPSILGTIVELNVVRDVPVAYHLGNGSDGVLFRRNHAYFWYPVNNSDKPPVAFQIDRANAHVVLDSNTVEGEVGELNPRDVIRLQEPE